MTFYSSKIAKIFKVGGITVWPFIFIAHSKDECPEWLLRHEQGHLRQQLRWFIIPFYVVYLLDYFIGRLKGYGHTKAYRNIRFEKEAYQND